MHRRSLGSLFGLPHVISALLRQPQPRLAATLHASYALMRSAISGEIGPQPFSTRDSATWDISSGSAACVTVSHNAGKTSSFSVRPRDAVDQTCVPSWFSSRKRLDHCVRVVLDDV